MGLREIEIASTGISKVVPSTEYGVVISGGGLIGVWISTGDLPVQAAWVLGKKEPEWS